MAAYDFNVLIKKLESRGLAITEELAKGVTDDVFTWAEESIKESVTPFDDVLLVILPALKQAVNNLEDKIDPPAPVAPVNP